MHGDGPAMPDSGHLGQFEEQLGGGPHRGRGHRGGRGGGGRGPFRRAPMLEPAVLERHRRSTAALVARQLAHVQVSESLAGQKVCSRTFPALYSFVLFVIPLLSENTLAQTASGMLWR